MPDYIGNIAVPTVAASGTFPIERHWPFFMAIEPEIVVHQFGAGNAKREQRFYLSAGVRRWEMNQVIGEDDLVTLMSFWESHQGGYQPFTFYAPSASQTFAAYNAQFENEPLVWEHLPGQQVRVTIRVREWKGGAAPSYSLIATVTRFVAGSLGTALTAQAQSLVPLVHIVPRKTGYPDNIYLSNQRMTIGGQLYQERLLRWEGIQQVAVGVPGVSAESDDVTLVFGNADRVMRQLAADVQLDYARVEFSLFHPLTRIKLDLWAGQVVPGGWQANAGPEFTLKCSDPLASPNMLAPDRIIDRKCPKLYNDGVACPFASVGALDLVHFPTATSSSCDRGYETPNGCLAHGMKRYYGGVFVVPQALRFKDNSTGFFGIGRSAITSVSLIADSVFGHPLPEIYTDIDMPVNGLIVTGRDEGDFYHALIVVGEGPLTAYGTGHKLDGQLNHGPGVLGLREALGADPAGAGDFFSLDYNGDQTGGDWRKVYSGNSTFLDNFAASVAFLAIRRTDEKGLQLTRLDEHSAEAIVHAGLAGWTWTAPGSRTLTAPLTNPVWIAVNRYLRSLGLKNASAATQEAAFDVPAAIAAAAVCNLTVAKLVGTGTETQWKFIGKIEDQRPLRDWLNDILLNCLGYYSFAFGKLRIGIRDNSSSIAAFTSGNMLWRSLQLEPLGPQFNRLTATFADPLQDVVTGDNQFVPNTATFQDDDYAQELGAGTKAVYLDSQMNLVGTANLSQAQRFANTRGREEVGGVTEAERKAARRVRWKSTVLGADVGPGDVVSITDDEMPGGFGEVRITRMRFLPDFSVEYEGRTTTDSMYDLVAGPKPADVVPGPVPPESMPYPFRPAWCANAEQPAAGDPLYAAGHNTFGLAQRYEVTRTDGKLAFLDITGCLPVNRFITDALSPLVRTVQQSSTGGFLEADLNLSLAVCARDAEGRFTPPSNIKAVTIANGTSTNKVTLTDITWPPGAYAGYVVFAGDNEKRICAQAEVTGALPASIVIPGPLKPSTYNLPSPVYRRVVAKVKREIHGGAIGIQVSGVAAGKVTLGGIAGMTDDYTGRVLTVFADLSDGSAPLWNFSITAHNLGTGELTVTPDPEAAGVEIGDVAVIRYQANIATTDTIGDTKIQNDVYPDGLIPDDEIGAIVRIVAGTGAGQWRRVASNTQNTYTLETPWDTVPDATSVFIVEAGEWQYQAETSEVSNAFADVASRIPVRVDDLINQPVVVGVFIEDRRGDQTPEEFIAVRDTYLFGEGLRVRVIGSDTVLDSADQVVLVDTSGGPVTVTLPPVAFHGRGRRVYVKKITDDINQVTIQPAPASGDAIDGAAVEVLKDLNDATELAGAETE